MPKFEGKIFCTKLRFMVGEKDKYEQHSLKLNLPFNIFRYLREKILNIIFILLRLDSKLYI